MAYDGLGRVLLKLDLRMPSHWAHPACAEVGFSDQYPSWGGGRQRDSLRRNWGVGVCHCCWGVVLVGDHKGVFGFVQRGHPLKGHGGMISGEVWNGACRFGRGGLGCAVGWLRWRGRLMAWADCPCVSLNFCGQHFFWDQQGFDPGVHATISSLWVRHHHVQSTRLTAL